MSNKAWINSTGKQFGYIELIHPIGFLELDIVKMDFLLNGEKVDALVL